MNNIEMLKKLQELGVCFSVSVPAPYGTQTFVCGPYDMLELLKDPSGFHAKCYEVTKSEYLGCVEEEFSLVCAGTTANGKRCKNIVEDGTAIEPKEWVERQGEYCHVHNGDNASI